MRHDLDPLKDGEPWRDQFGPEDFEDEQSAQDRYRTDRQNEKKAALMRIALRQFERNFDILVANDTRSDALCRHCKAHMTGDRARPNWLASQLRKHRCAALVEMSAPYLVRVGAGEEAFS